MGCKQCASNAVSESHPGDVQPRSLTLAALALAGASLAGVALTSAGWRLGLGALTLAVAGGFGGLLDGNGHSAPRRTVTLLGALTYLAIVPVLGFAARGLEELGAPPERWWSVAAFGIAELLAAFFGVRHWRRERGGKRRSEPVAAALSR